MKLPVALILLLIFGILGGCSSSSPAPSIPDAFAYDFSGATGYVIEDDASTQIKRAAQNAKKTLGDLVQIANGTSDDVEIQKVIDASDSGTGMAVIDLGGGEFTISSTILLDSNVVLKNGVITLADNSNCDMINTRNFDTLTMTNAWYVDTESVPYGFGLIDITLDGNKDNQTSGHGVEIYGKGYYLDNLIIIDCFDSGFVSECGDQVGQHDWRDKPECYVGQIDVRNCGDDGILFRGPHDTIFDKIIVSSNGRHGFQNQYSSGSYGGACDIKYIHSYSNGEDGIRLGRSAHIGYCETETNTKCGLKVDSTTCMVDTANIYSNSGTAVWSTTSGTDFLLGEGYIFSNTGTYTVALEGQRSFIQGMTLYINTCTDLVRLMGSIGRVDFLSRGNTTTGNHLYIGGAAGQTKTNLTVDATITGEGEGCIMELNSGGNNHITVTANITGTETDWDYDTYAPDDTDYISYHSTNQTVKTLPNAEKYFPTLNSDNTFNGKYYQKTVTENSQGFGNLFGVDTDGTYIDATCGTPNVACVAMAVQSGTGSSKDVIFSGEVRDNAWDWSSVIGDFGYLGLNGDVVSGTPSTSGFLIQPVCVFSGTYTAIFGPSVSTGVLE